MFSVFISFCSTYSDWLSILLAAISKIVTVRPVNTIKDGQEGKRVVNPLLAKKLCTTSKPQTTFAAFTTNDVTLVYEKQILNIGGFKHYLPVVS